MEHSPGAPSEQGHQGAEGCVCVKEGARGGMERGAQLVTKRPVSVVVVRMGWPLSRLRGDMAIHLVYEV